MRRYSRLEVYRSVFRAEKRSELLEQLERLEQAPLVERLERLERAAVIGERLNRALNLVFNGQPLFANIVCVRFECPK